MRLKILGSHVGCKVANKCLNICERVKVVKRKKDGPLRSSAVLLIASVRERQKTLIEKTKDAKEHCNNRLLAVDYCCKAVHVRCLRGSWLPLCRERGRHTEDNRLKDIQVHNCRGVVKYLKRLTFENSSLKFILELFGTSFQRNTTKNFFTWYQTRLKPESQKFIRNSGNLC